MSTKKIASRLDRWEKEFNDLKRTLLDCGYVCPGSVVERYMPCGKSTCRCMTNANNRHGPYYEWSQKIRGKTVTVRLTKEQAAFYAAFTKNNQKLRKTCERMRSISMKIAQQKRTLRND
jgi:hypothetical protein